MTLGKASWHEVSSGWNSYLFLERRGDQSLEKAICHPSSVGHPPPPPFPITGKTVVGICGKRGVRYHNSRSKACEQTGRLLWDYLLLFFPPWSKEAPFCSDSYNPRSLLCPKQCHGTGTADSSHRHNPARFHLYVFQNASPENEFQKGETLNHFLLLKIKIKVI